MLYCVYLHFKWPIQDFAASTLVMDKTPNNYRLAQGQRVVQLPQAKSTAVLHWSAQRELFSTQTNSLGFISLREDKGRVVQKCRGTTLLHTCNSSSRSYKLSIFVIGHHEYLLSLQW